MTSICKYLYTKQPFIFSSLSMSKKKKILLSIVAVVVLAGAIFVSLPAGRNMFANVLSIRGWSKPCNDSDLWANFDIQGTTNWLSITDNTAVVRTDTCGDTTTLNEYVCTDRWPTATAQKYVNTINYKCPNGCSNGICVPVGYGYGYGYNSGSTYGYGYGYKKFDKNGQAWMYLLIPFKIYTKAIYDAVISKIGFIMVNHYNTKEFIDPTAKDTKPIAPSIRE